MSSQEGWDATEHVPPIRYGVQRSSGLWAFRRRGRRRVRAPSAQSRRRGKPRCSAGCGQKLIRQASEFPVAGRARSLPATSLANAAALQHLRAQHRFAFTESAQSAIDRLTAVIHQRFGKRKALVIKCRITQSMARADLQFGSAPATNPGAPAIEPERLQRAGRS